MSPGDNTEIAGDNSLPDGWVWATLGDVSEKSQYGWTTKANHDTGRLKLLRTTDITSGSIDWSSVPYCTDEPEVVEKYLLESGDVLISRAGSVGVSFLINKPERAVFASYLIRFRPKKDVVTKYFYYYLKTPAYWNAIGASKSGIAVPNVNASKLSLVPIPLAPINQQKRIVAEIEKQFSRLDEAVANLKRVKANLKRYKAAVLKAAVEGRLVETEAELARREGRGFETGEQLLQRILGTRRSHWQGKGKYKELAAPNTTNLRELPEGWVWANVDQLGTLGEQAVLTGPFGSNMGRSDFQDSGVPVLTIGCLQEAGLSNEKAVFVSDAKAEELARYRLKAGDILFSRMASVGRAGFVTILFDGALFNYHLMRLRLERAVVEPMYFIFFVRGAKTVQNYVREVNHGATRDGINTEQLLNLPVALPPWNEQHRIVAEVDRRLSLLREIEVQVNANLQRAERLRQAVLSQAFSGGLA